MILAREAVDLMIDSLLTWSFLLVTHTILPYPTAHKLVFMRGHIFLVEA